ncbi:MAG: nicotinate-nucleotide adenylyltransferase [Vicinamibacterales bacterium]
MRTVGVLGGTFDPVHVGHVAVGVEAQRALGLDEIRFVPSSVPPHRSGPRVSGYHRFTMAALVALGRETWTVSDAELRRDGPSFSYDTLAGLAAEGLAPTQIFFLIGADAFAEIATWHRYPAVLDLAHFVVVARPGTALAALRDRVPDLAPRLVDPGAAGGRGTTGIVLVDAATPGVSSTDIRERAARGEPLAGLVTEPVERYIRRHGLYGSGPHW